MMKKTDIGAVDGGSNPRRARRSTVAFTSWFATRRARVRLDFFAAVTIGPAFPIVNWLTEPPKVEPPFETIVDPGAGPVKEFALKDVFGSVHGHSEWNEKAAVVLFFLAPTDPNRMPMPPR